MDTQQRADYIRRTQVEAKRMFGYSDLADHILSLSDEDILDQYGYTWDTDQEATDAN